MEAEEVGMDIQDKVPGFIFMCNRMTKPECYRFRVFALPAGRREIVKKINPGAYLFLFYTDVKLLYGVYLATSAGMLNLEPLAFGGRYPAQVKFKIHKECLPLPENRLKHAIKDNYKKHSSKFDCELSIEQVRSLLEMFPPLDILSAAATTPVLNEIYSPPTLPSPPVNGVYQQTSRTSFTEESILSRMSPNQDPRHLNYQHVNEPGKPTDSAYPVNNLMQSSVAAQFVPNQASGNQTHAPHILNLHSEFHSSLMQNPQHGYAQSWQGSQRTHLNVVHPQPESHSSMRTIGNRNAPSMQDPQHAHLNALHPQHVGNSYAQSMQDPQHADLTVLHPQLVGNSYSQSMQDPQHAHHNVFHPQSGSHPSTWNMGGSYAQSVQHSQYAHLNVLQPAPQPEFHSSMMTMGNSYPQSLQDPQNSHQSIPNPQPGFHPQGANVGSGHAQMLWDPHGTHQNIPYSQPDAYSNTATMGSSYAQSFQDPQHAHQNALNLQPYSSSSVVNMNHANVVASQSHAQSALYYPYVPQKVTSATYSNQTGAIQEVIYSGQQTGTGSEYYQPSMQTENASTAENVASHLHQAN